MLVQKGSALALQSQTMKIMKYISITFLVSVFTPSLANPTCDTLLQSSNIQYLNSSQRSRYNISDPCMTTCANGYYGDFCRDLARFDALSVGPWNQAGYCTFGPGVLRTMTIDVSSLVSVQYTSKDSVLIGISNPGQPSTMGAMASVVSEISLYSRSIQPVLYPTPAGSLDALLVRKGVVYVARTVKVNGLNTYDIVVMTAPMQVQMLMPISVKTAVFDVCVDKGTVTSFVYASNQISACYPDKTCVLWVGFINTVSGMLIGADCQNTLYVSSTNKIFKVTKDGLSLYKTADTTIYCLTGIPSVNVLIYKSTNYMWQVNLGSGEVTNIPLGVAQTQQVQCSADVSEKNNQILIVQNGIIGTLEAVQQPCPSGSTSTALLCNSTKQCTACPLPPSDAYNVEGSVSCEWVCRAGFKQIGSKCVSSVTLPCPEYYRKSSVVSSLCIPAVMPWAGRGKYVTSTAYSEPNFLPAPSAPVYLIASEGNALIHAIPGYFYFSSNGGVSWIELSFSPYSAAKCPYIRENSYYYLSSRQGVLWVAFTQQRVEGIQHCLWAVNASEAVATEGSKTLKVVRAWVIDRKLCSATGEGGGVYVIFCKDNYVSYSGMQAGSVLSPFIGSPIPGYANGLLHESKFNGPTSLVAHDLRLYITDTGNCVIREVDIIRAIVMTVAGTPGTCLRNDGTGDEAMLMYPTILSYTAYDGVFLFIDRMSNRIFEFVRQFHALTSTVNTIQVSPFEFSSITSLAASDQGILVLSRRAYYVYSASQLPCPAGTSSLPGNAFGVSECRPCPMLHYSDADSGSCKPCSTPLCDIAGQLFVACQLDLDAHCGSCTNKPAEASKYIGASSIPGTLSGGGDCSWVYTPPCPKGFFASDSFGGSCATCPPWSTTASAGSGALSDCVCLGDGAWIDGVCVIPSPFASQPTLCHPLELCPSYSDPEPSSSFSIMSDCDSFDVDSPGGICPCNPGEFIQQFYPKICTVCPSGLYSPDGIRCRVCPYLTEPSLDKVSCQCTFGSMDTSLVQAEPRCVCNQGSFFSFSVGCRPCQQNTYSVSVISHSIGELMQPSQCIDCVPGTWALPGSTTCISCIAGQFRRASDLLCQDCAVNAYAPDPAVAVCVDCVETCNGRKETPCFGNDDLFMCSDCQAPRSNSDFNGKRDCATTCHPGFFESDGECVKCAEFSKNDCPPGNSFVECSAYVDSYCAPCVNETLPLNFAEWTYESDESDGPNLSCNWQCKSGYTLTLSKGTLNIFECTELGRKSLWDIFTI